MNKVERYTIIIQLLNCIKEEGSWGGETHIQKSAFLLQELTRIPLGYEFVLYKHGPYSFSLADEITAMRADGLMEIVPQDPPYGPSLQPTKLGLLLAKKFHRIADQYREAVDFVAALVGKSKVTKLEKMSTAFYFINKDMNQTDVDHLAQLISFTKPHISVVEAKASISNMFDVLKNMPKNISRKTTDTRSANSKLEERA